jgi:prepilin-type N-terminal cleavage/methylation domain-containing protein
MLTYNPVARVHTLLHIDCAPGAGDYNPRSAVAICEGECGFSVIEILIVLAILAIVAMVAIPVTSSAANMQLRSAANMIAADLEYAKNMAITRTQDFSVVFDCSNKNYWIENPDGTIIPHPVKKGSNYVVDLRGEGLDKVDILDADFDSASTVKFDYLGSPHNASDSPLGSGVIKLHAGGATITITVEPVTGFVSIAN